jgi:hypothetical protein
MKQLKRLATMQACPGNTDTHAKGHCMSIDGKGARQEAQQHLGEFHGHGSVPHDQPEAIAAGATDKRGTPSDRSQALRHQAKQLLADGRAHPVIHVAKAINIQEHDREAVFAVAMHAQAASKEISELRA